MEAVNKAFGENLSEQDYTKPRIKSGMKGSPFLRPERFTLNTHEVSLLLRIKDIDGRTEYTRQTNQSQVSAVNNDDISSSRLNSAHGGTHGNKRRTPNAHARFIDGDVNDNSGKSGSGKANNAQARGETASVMSDLTLPSRSDISTATGNPRFGWLKSGEEKFSSSGRDLLTAQMMKYNHARSIPMNEVNELLMRASKRPIELLGWQIMFFDKHNIDNEKCKS